MERRGEDFERSGASFYTFRGRSRPSSVAQPFGESSVTVEVGRRLNHFGCTGGCSPTIKMLWVRRPSRAMAAVSERGVGRWRCHERG